jgi:hypothetical protein
MAHRLAVLGGTAALVLGTVCTAYAATGSPPVTVPDHAVVRADQPTPVDVLANDSDPDGDELQVCRLGDLPRALRASQVQGGQLLVLPGRGARGTYTLTYYACDTSYLTPGTLTVRVRPPAPRFLIEPLGPPPGKIRLVNQLKHVTFHCQWHSLDSEKVLGKATVKPQSTVVITVRVAEFEIESASPHYVVGAGFVSGRQKVTRHRR